jgi:signal transduction histidine kinase
LLFEEPLFSSFPGGPRHGPFDRDEAAWLIFDLNPAYLRDVLLPRIVQRDLGADYQVEVTTRTNPLSVVYRSDPGQSQDIAGNADASVNLFGLPANFGGRRGPPDLRDRGPGHGPEPDSGRWRMFVRHRAGSLENVAAQSRWRSLAVTGGVLLLILATAAALIRYTRRAQRLAELQIEFVAGVSHELRTPLTVIHTAAYNLQGRVAGDPAQVKTYGALIQRESARLVELVEQVLQFASVSAGRAPHAREPLSVETVIDETMEANKAVIDDCHCVVVKSIDPDLPPILGDPKAMRQVIENLICNAAKYGTYRPANGGTDGSNWVGISASKASTAGAVEIRVSDRGPGIPANEQEQIFDPFFRGARAIEDQIHGTGLGLSLVKKIVEAHGGSVRVKSEPMKGAEFIVLLPAAPAGAAG